MQEYIEQIISSEQDKFVDQLVSKYGKLGDFTKEEIYNKFLKQNRNTIVVNDSFKNPGKRGRPKKT